MSMPYEYMIFVLVTQNASTRFDNSTIQQVLVMENAARDHEEQENIEGRVKR